MFQQTRKPKSGPQVRLTVSPGEGSQFEAQRIPPRPSGETISFENSRLRPMVRIRTDELDARRRELYDIVKNYVAIVERNPKALEMLANMNEHPVMHEEDFGGSMDWGTGVAIGLLTAARLCDIDSIALRLRDDGIELIQDLRAIAKT